MVLHSVRRAKELLDIQDDRWRAIAGIRQFADLQAKWATLMAKLSA
jgi:hypothetical protein